MSGWTSDLARELAPEALERFLRYVRVDTQVDPSSTTYPSTARQLELSRMLVAELLEIGLADAELTEHGYVLATLPATVERDTPAIGWLAHVDVSEAVPAAGVKPIVHRGYAGGRLDLPGEPDQVLNPLTAPKLADHLGHDIVTSDGSTLLGADDKAGVAEIMTAVAYLLRHPEIPHGRIRVAFTVDEEIGKGVLHFPVERFGVVCAYTMDGSTVPEIEAETFNASQMTITIRGHSVHTGTAKGRLVNAQKLAARLVTRLPDHLAPETTDDREGFVHLSSSHGSTEEAQLVFIVRDHDWDRLLAHEALLRGLADGIAAEEPRATVTVERVEQYRNMREAIERYPRVLEAAYEATRRAGMEPVAAIIRGGTDGSKLSAMGVPTPNLFTGGHDYHSKREWICVQDMGSACATLVQLAQVWAE